MMKCESFRAELCEWTLALSRSENAHTPLVHTSFARSLIDISWQRADSATPAPCSGDIESSAFDNSKPIDSLIVDENLGQRLDRSAAVTRECCVAACGASSSVITVPAAGMDCRTLKGD